MKRWVICVLLVVGAYLLPKRPVELGKLIPVELVCLGKTEGMYWVRTDTGDSGQGTTVNAAVQNLRDTTAGDLFLDTAEYLLVTEDTTDAISQIAQYLKGKTYICIAGNEIDPAAAVQYLSAHPPKLRLKDWKTGSKPEYLQQIGKQFVFQ